MRVMADTHALLWWVLNDRRLSAGARVALSPFSNEVLVSAASAWEIATKVRIGKLPGVEAFAAEFTERIAKLGFLELPIDVEHARRAGALGGTHEDPFDRLLIAQAQTLGIPIVSCDEVFDDYGVQRIW